MRSLRSSSRDRTFRLGAWSLGASYAYTDAHVSAPGLPLDHLQPAQTASHQASATLTWSPTIARLSAILRYVGRQYEDDLNTETLKGAVTLDAIAGMPIAHGFSIELRGENVTNTRVEAGISGADVIERATPRTLWVGLRYGQDRASS